MSTTLLVAGATGAVGTLLVPAAQAKGLTVLAHVRPKTAATHPLGKDPAARIFDLGDAAALDAAMASATAVACLVGTTRHRFAAGDTYESSDYLPVVQLVDAARRAPGPARHFVLLSSLGARKGSGYLGWKWRAEEAVRQSGLPWTILRPSVFDARGTPAAPSDGRKREPPPLFNGAVKVLSVLPGLGSLARKLRPMPLDVLAARIVRCVVEGGPTGVVLDGDALFEV